MQSGGVQAVTKHLIGNEQVSGLGDSQCGNECASNTSQETQRMPSINLLGPTIESVSSNIDDRTMHELYLWPFANAVHAGTAGVMCSYNRLNRYPYCHQLYPIRYKADGVDIVHMPVKTQRRSMVI